MFPRSAPALEFAQASDSGRVRTGNEDAVLTDPAVGLAAVADGLGSYHAGDVASSLALDAIREFVTQGFRTAGRVSPSGSTSGSLLLRDALLRANEMVCDRARSQPLYAGMGATVVAALFYAERVAIAHVGDARAYRWRRGQLEQLTRDHVRQHAGAEPPGPARQVTRALGVRPAVMVDLLDAPLDPGDVYLLCSDGLHAMVPDEDIGLTLQIFGDNLGTAAKQLIKLANNNGGRDNVSVIVAQRSSAPLPPRRGLRGWMHKWFT